MTDELTRLTDERAVLCLLDKPEPLAFLNIYEMGDVWVKTVGCEGCDWDSRKKCCGTCPMLTEQGCVYHLEGKRNKPFRCMVIPAPDVHRSWCQQEFLCEKGSHERQTRRTNEPRNVFVD